MARSKQILPNSFFKTELAEAPFRILMVDSVGPIRPETPGGNKYCLAAVDMFTDWGWIVPIPDLTAKTVAEVLVTRVFCDLSGFPVILRTDRGSEFVNEVIKAINEICGVSHVLGTPFHPRGQSRIEGSHVRLNDVMAKLTDKMKSNWGICASFAQWTWRTTPKERLNGRSPYEVVTGLTPQQPLDMLIGVEGVRYRDVDDYVTDLITRMKETWKDTRK